MSTNNQSETLSQAKASDAEMLSSLLFELEDALAAASLSSDAPSPLKDKWKMRSAAINMHLEHMTTLHAPWLNLGRSWRQWLVWPFNLLIRPWGRKQAAFNADVQQILCAFNQMNADSLDTADAVARLETRIAHIESLMRKLIACKMDPDQSTT